MIDQREPSATGGIGSLGGDREWFSTTRPRRMRGLRRECPCRNLRITAADRQFGRMRRTALITGIGLVTFACVALAYAITIHKSQGSEFPAVVIPLAMQQYLLLQRNLVYTGITRGRKLVVVISINR